jgi:hypothetical protein
VSHCGWWVTSHCWKDKSDDDGVTGSVNSVVYCVVLLCCCKLILNLEGENPMHTSTCPECVCWFCFDIEIQNEIRRVQSSNLPNISANIFVPARNKIKRKRDSMYRPSSSGIAQRPSKNFCRRKNARKRITV